MTNLYEQKIIGGIATGTIAPSKVNLDQSDFSDPDLGKAFSVALMLESQNIEIDPEVLYMATAEKDVFYSSQDFATWGKMSVSASVVLESARRVKSTALKQFLLEKATEISLSDGKTGEQLLHEFQQVLRRSEMFYKEHTNNFKFIGELAPRMQSLYTDLYNGIAYAVPTYMPTRDEKLLDGYSRGDLHLIVGFTGSGKSSLALTDAKAQAEHGHVVGFVTREMTSEENIMRIQASGAGVGRYEIRKEMREPVYRTLMAHLDYIEGLPIAFDSDTDNVDQLCSNARVMVEEYNMAILYVDYLQLMTDGANSDTRANEVQSISRKLKQLAMDLKIPVVALCQFNNGVLNASIYDVMNYIRESGSIKQDASTIQYIQVEQTDKPKLIKDAQWTPLKNRNGECYTALPLNFEGAKFLFTEKG